MNINFLGHLDRQSDQIAENCDFKLFFRLSRYINKKRDLMWFVHYHVQAGTKYSRMDQAKFAEDGL